MNAQDVLDAALSVLVRELFHEEYVPTAWADGEAEDWLVKIASGATLGVTLSVDQLSWVPCLN